MVQPGGEAETRYRNDVELELTARLPHARNNLRGRTPAHAAQKGAEDRMAQSSIHNLASESPGLQHTRGDLPAVLRGAQQRGLHQRIWRAGLGLQSVDHPNGMLPLAGHRPSLSNRRPRQMRRQPIRIQTVLSRRHHSPEGSAPETLAEGQSGAHAQQAAIWLHGKLLHRGEERQGALPLGYLPARLYQVLEAVSVRLDPVMHQHPQRVQRLCPHLSEAACGDGGRIHRPHRKAIGEQELTSERREHPQRSLPQA
mmetsp:Transcript_32688/g.94108  ORF Transcript_32688/g.94108 Transcript_32688/m.94108 type:complete len:255 (-) Transcript_32688:114-878(-)